MLIHFSFNILVRDLESNYNRHKYAVYKRYFSFKSNTNCVIFKCFKIKIQVVKSIQ